MRKGELKSHARTLYATALKLNALAVSIGVDGPFRTKDWAAPPFYSVNDAAYCEQIIWAAEGVLRDIENLEDDLKEVILLADKLLCEHERAEIADVLCGNRTVEDIKQENAKFVRVKVADMGDINMAMKPFFARRKRAMEFLDALAGQQEAGGKETLTLPVLKAG